MKKRFSLLLVLVMLLSLFACGKDNPQSTNPSTNPGQSTDGTEKPSATATEGKEAGHSYKDATCTAPKTCTKCGATEGKAAAHSYSNGACTVCGAMDPNVPFTDHVWFAYIEKPCDPNMPETGEILAVYYLNPTNFQGYTYKEFYANINYESNHYGNVTHNGKTYYDFWFSASMNGIEWEDNGDTVKVTFAYDDPALVLILTRTGETQFTVTSSSDTTDIPVGTVFTYQP